LFFFDSRCRLADRWKGVKWISCAQAETASLPRPLHQRHTLRCHHFTELTCRRVRWSVSSASHAPVVESQNVSKKHDELPSSFRMSSSRHLPPNPVYRSAMNQHTQWHARSPRHRVSSWRCTQGEATSQSLWSRYDHHFVGITRYNALR